MRGTGLALTCVLLLGACTTDRHASSAGAQSRGDQCFNASFVNNFRPVGRDAVDVSISRRQVYRLSLSAGCFDIDWAQRVALRSRTGTWICGPADAELIVPSVVGRSADRCTVLDVRRLSREEIEAGRARRR